MLSKEFINLAVSLFCIAFIGCAGSPQKTMDRQATRALTAEESDNINISNAAAVEAKAHDFVEIKFEPGSDVLTESAKASLNATLEQAQKSGKIEEVLVLSWSDQEFPAKTEKKLSKAQRELAGNRNETVEKFLKTTRSLKVESYNMAEQPSILSKVFNTTDSRLKKSLISAGLPTNADTNQYPSKASHSVVLVKIE